MIDWLTVRDIILALAHQRRYSEAADYHAPVIRAIKRTIGLAAADKRVQPVMLRWFSGQALYLGLAGRLSERTVVVYQALDWLRGQFGDGYEKRGDYLGLQLCLAASQVAEGDVGAALEQTEQLVAGLEQLSKVVGLHAVVWAWFALHRVRFCLALLKVKPLGSRRSPVTDPCPAARDGSERKVKGGSGHLTWCSPPSRADCCSAAMLSQAEDGQLQQSLDMLVSLWSSSMTREVEQNLARGMPDPFYAWVEVRRCCGID